MPGRGIRPLLQRWFGRRGVHGRLFSVRVSRRLRNFSCGILDSARYNGTESDSTIVASGAFTTPISIGVDYTLSVDWDGSKFIFKIDGETIEYTPGVSTVLPANQPVKGLDTFIRNNSGKEATIAALFDDVRIVESSSLYATYTGYGLYKYDGTTWTRIDTVEPVDMAASGTYIIRELHGIRSL